MIWPLDFILLIIILILSVAAITVRDLLSAAIILGGFSFMMALLWTEMGAVDVAITEASVGAGVSTVFFVAALHHTNRRSKD